NNLKLKLTLIYFHIDYRRDFSEKAE
ncbi:MAG: hypothetical protein K940chlam4_00999, partial [Candidatus Anoxychlamydiales bacterium]|nr:hypothetical protein [Candidatus Anoxychlamydiales bacterium]